MNTPLRLTGDRISTTHTYLLLNSCFILLTRGTLAHGKFTFGVEEVGKTEPVRSRHVVVGEGPETRHDRQETSGVLKWTYWT